MMGREKSMAEKIVRIGGASGYWGDTALGPAQLVAAGVDYLVFDYLAEITMSILAKARARDAEAGFATDFAARMLPPLLPEIARRGIRVVANAGGVNLPACRRAIEKAVAEAGLSLKVGTVEGDDLLARAGELRAAGAREMTTGAALPERLMSVNAYLGAFPIAAALDSGADIVVTGRCVDSALAAGPLIHEFGWRPDDHDLLAAAGLVGHLIECGAQATGGNFTDWREVEAGWADTGFPIAEVRGDGGFVLTKPDGSGGRVTTLTAAEQMLYETGDPAAYVLPDVVCDFTHVTMEQAGADRVRIAGARGRPPTGSYKVSATHASGFGCIATALIVGEAAAARARRHGEAVLERTGRMLAESGLPPFAKTSVHVVGAESLYGAAADADSVARLREAVLRVGIHHASPEAADLFSREFVGAALSMAPGLTLLSPGRPKPTPIVRLFSLLVDKDEVPVSVAVDGEPVALAQAAAKGDGAEAAPSPSTDEPPTLPGTDMAVPLRRLAVARSGDKGNDANIGIIARKPDYLPFIRAALTPEAVRDRFAHLVKGEVERYELPGVHALNFLLRDALGGGGTASLNLDPQAKTYAQVLLDMPVAVPWDVADETA